MTNKERNSPLGLASFNLACATHGMIHKCWDSVARKEQLAEALYNYAVASGQAQQHAIIIND